MNRNNVGLIHRNLTTLRYEDRVSVLLTDAYRWARAYTPEDDEPIVVLLDPPYREYEVHGKKISQLLGLLIEKLPGGSVLAVESGKLLSEQVLPDFEAWDIRRYGGTQVAVRVVPPRDGSNSTVLEGGGTIDDDADTDASASPAADPFA